MPRTYVPKPGAKLYKKYDELVMKQALDELETTNSSIIAVAKKHNISKSVLYRHKNKEMKPHGRPTALSKLEEEYIVENINICGDWGYPIDTTDLRYIIKMYLDSHKIKHRIFKNNLPGKDYVNCFLKRHKYKISQRTYQNIKRSRAAVSPEIIKQYFGELEKSLENVDPENIINYDETNLTDDPGRKQVLVRRGCKYPERVVNHSKGSISLMMAATASEEMLPPYVVYKATHMYDTWAMHGPTKARYNRSKSGWFDGEIFSNWVKTVVIPFLENRSGKKILIGDNLASHMSVELIQLCKEKDIEFVFLPANSTHLTQPLDVAFFRPMKIVWRQILEQWKNSDDGRSQSCVAKGCFPRLLKLLMDQLEVNAKENIQSGFRKCGIVPLDSNEVLSRLPQEENRQANKEAVSESFLQFLKEMRYGSMNVKEPKTKRKVEVVSGQSVSGEEVQQNQEQEPVKQRPKTKRKLEVVAGPSVSGEEVQHNQKKEPVKQRPKTERKLEVVAGQSVSGEEVQKKQEQEPVKSKKKRTEEPDNKSNKYWKGKGIGKKTKAQTVSHKISSAEIIEQTKNIKTDLHLIETNIVKNHELQQQMEAQRSQDDLNCNKNKQMTDKHIRTDSVKTVPERTPETAILSLNKIRDTNDDQRIVMSVNFYDNNEITKPIDLNIESMPFIFADDFICQEITVETDIETDDVHESHDDCEKENQSEKDNKCIDIRLKPNIKKEPKIKILSNVKLQQTCSKNNSTSIAEMGIKKESKSTFVKKERSFSFYKDKQEILKILEHE